MSKLLFNTDLLNGTFDWVNDDYSLLIMDDTYVDFNSDTYVSDIVGGTQGTVALTNKAVESDASNVYLIADLTPTFGVISGGIELDSVLLVRDTGVDTTSYLVSNLSAGNVTGLPYTTTGVEVDLELSTFVGITAGRGIVMEIST